MKTYSREFFKAISFTILPFALLFLVACSSESPHMQRPPAAVTIDKVIQRETPIYLESIGNTSAFQTIQVKAQVGGVLLNAHVKEGQKVKAGDLLFTLDTSTYAADVEKAKANLAKDEAYLAFAKIKLSHYTDLVEQEYVAKVTYEEFQNNVETAEAQVRIDKAILDAAEINLKRTSIYTPIEGRISSFKLQPGNLVIANDPLFLTEIRQVSPLDVHFSLSQKDLHEVRKHMNHHNLKFDVLLPHQKNPVSRGEVYFIDNHVDISTGTILLKGKIANKNELLWPGQFVRVRVYLKTLKEALLVPIEAVQLGQQGEYVYVIKEDKTAELRLITRGMQVDQFYIIENGVSKDEQVVITGQLNLQPGAPVRIIEANNEG